MIRPASQRGEGAWPFVEILRTLLKFEIVPFPLLSSKTLSALEVRDFRMFHWIFSFTFCIWDMSKVGKWVASFQLQNLQRLLYVPSDFSTKKCLFGFIQVFKIFLCFLFFNSQRKSVLNRSISVNTCCPCVFFPLPIKPSKRKKYFSNFLVNQKLFKNTIHVQYSLCLK